uniref:Tropomyosin-like n=1 Tax=Elaeis guineensis var. tenera TaxID=51953 RepID=A0A6I9S4Q9_ELAGV|nr:tropomyosin-like [Elaeis guineensis]
MQLLHVLINLSDRLAKEAQVREAEEKVEIEVQIARTKIKELEVKAKNLQEALGQVETDLALTLEREKEAERRAEEHIQDTKHSSIEKFKAHKKGWVDCRKSIEEEHLELDLIFLNYEDEDKDDEKIFTASELPIYKKENVAEPLSSSTADAGLFEPLSDTTPQEKSVDDAYDVGSIAATPLLATPLSPMTVVNIKAHIKGIEEKLKVFEGETADREKKLQKAQKKLDEAEKEVNRLQQEVR